AVQEHLDHRQVLRVVAQLDTPAREGGINGIGITFQRDGRDPGHPPGHRPAERLPDQGRVRLPARAAGTEPVDGRLPGLGVHPPVGDLPGAANQSLSWSGDSIPWWVASARNASRIYRFALSCFPRPCGEYGLLWIRRMPSTAQVRASHAFANGAPLS